jgi:hypothetical protein
MTQNSKIIAYLSGTGTDHRGRTLEDILAFDDDRLESEHDYIQWLFPLDTHSNALAEAPILTEADIVQARGDVGTIRDNIQRSVKRMRLFYSQNDHWLEPRDHNHLRITRILKSSQLLHSYAQAEVFYNHIMEIVLHKDAYIDPTHVAYWTDAMGLSYGNRG